jgi:hypothetical protein
MLPALAALVLVILCLIAREIIYVHRELSSIRQFLEWSAVGLLEKADLSPARREYIEKIKEDLMREGHLSQQQVDDLQG